MKVSLMTLLVVLCIGQLHAQLRLPRIISDNVVLQREAPLPLFGWATRGETITIALSGVEYSAPTDDSGKWVIQLPPQRAGGPYDIRFSSGDTSIVIHNVLFGDVWVCSGQSNMEMKMRNVKDKFSDAILRSNNSMIRHFDVPQHYDFKREHDDLNGGQWKSANPADVLQFSAVAYFFAVDLYDKLNIPIGLVNASLGGSPAEAWMSDDALKQFPHHLSEAKRLSDSNLIREIESADRSRIGSWYDQLNNEDAGIKSGWKWGVTDNTWSTIQLPGYWSEERGRIENGVVWFSRQFQVADNMEGQPARLFFGRVVDQDSIFINGRFVGTTGYQYPQRRYEIPSNLLRKGSNSIVVKVINQSGKGGFVQDKPYCITLNADTIDLKGEWKYKFGATMPALASQTFIRWKPMGLFNAMISPISRFPIKGVIWYQGESNVGRDQEYRKLFPALISDWRAKWRNNFPFLFVQLPNFMDAQDIPTESSWASFRQAQLETLRTHKTGMAVIIDVGEWNDIHPLDKRTVGQRLALQARKVAYQDSSLSVSGPLPKGVVFKKKKVVVEFTNVGRGLVAKNGGPIRHVSLSVDGKTFIWAKTRILNNKMIVWARSIRNPSVLRYAWADNPSTANLYNLDGLPASPFELRK
jgi:sialate O-acetylesterase